VTRRKRRVLVVLVVSAAVASASGAIAGSTAAPVRVRVLRLVDRSRRAQFRDGTSAARVLVTDVRYPGRGHGPFPLIVFGHGFALATTIYARLLDTWAQSGYVVAAPAFPVERPNAPGGPDQRDLVNEPRDISFVISRLLAPASPLHALIDPKKIAVAGHSDGAVAALAAAYDRRFRDARVDAAVVLSGATPSGFVRPLADSPPLLAVQGTRDTINAPTVTADYYRLMRRPKFLLWLLGAPHLAPYTTGDRWAAVVERVTTTFLDYYLRGGALRSLIAAGNRPGVARIASSP
jgi:dienelactone hydrolase